MSTSIRAQYEAYLHHHTVADDLIKLATIQPDINTETLALADTHARLALAAITAVSSMHTSGVAYDYDLAKVSITGD